jgi:hypothetical protein
MSGLSRKDRHHWAETDDESQEKTMKTIASLVLSSALLFSVTASAGSLSTYENCLYDLDVCLTTTR